MALGVETIYQYTAMVPQMSIARNIFIGREPVRFRIGPFGLLDVSRMGRESMEALRDVDLHLRSPETPVDELSGGERQGVTIARAMYFKTKVMILDEPTNHLSIKETNKVLGWGGGHEEPGDHQHLHHPQPAPRLPDRGPAGGPRTRARRSPRRGRKTPPSRS